jgi:hypothetical protein
MADDAAVSDGAKETRAPKLVLSDDEFLAIVAEQRRQSIGFGFANDSELAADRERSLLYYKGDVSQDIPALENRSAAVSTDVAEAIETVLPDLVEMLTAGDDVLTFQPSGPQDEATAEQETDYVRHVFLQENPGFLLITTGIKDALMTKLGVWKVFWEDGEEECEEQNEGKSLIEYQVAMKAAEAGEIELEDVEEVPPDPEDALGQPTWNYTVKYTKDTGCAKVMAIPSDDFTVAQNTVRLAETAYCAMKSRPYVQDLIAQGHDKDKVEALPAYSGASEDGQNAEVMDLARDTAGEHAAGQYAQSAHSGLKIVEIVSHVIRIDADGDGKPELWEVVTGGGETVFLSKTKIDQVPYAAITPYLIPHRFLGRSVADVLIEIQKIKTAVLRMLLDSGYFALNQRVEVAKDQETAWTLSDLMRQTPGGIVRTKNGTGIRPIQAGALNFDVQGALEYVSTMGEQRSGIKRHSMGLNPDTLHETASGALGQLNEAQKRMRFMARLFAEGGLKDLFLALHNVIRTHASQAATVRLRGQWADIDPSQWGVRKSMTVEVGPGKDHMLAGLNMLANWMKEIVTIQGGLHGDIVTPDKIVKLLTKIAELSGIKGAYFPSEQELMAKLQQAQGQPPAPDPKLQLAQAQHQNDQAKIALSGQQLQLDGRKQQLAEAQFQAEQQSAAVKAQADEKFRWAQLQQEAELTLAQIEAEYKTQVDTARIKAEAESLRTGADLTIKAAGQHHDLTMAAHEAAHAASAMTQQHAHEHVSAIRDAVLSPPPPPVPPDAAPDTSLEQ